MVNVAQNGSSGHKVHLNCIFNSSPIVWDGIAVTSLQQNSYGSFNIESPMDLKSVLKQLRNSNPKQRFCSKHGCDIIGEKFFDEEESELINKPESDVWLIQDRGNGKYTISIS